MKSQRFLISALLLAFFAASAAAQSADSARAGKVIPIAIIGSGAGILGGGAAGYGLCKATGWGNSGEDPCLGHSIAGAFAGSIIGSAVGAHLASDGASFSRSLTGALGGAVLGIGAAWVVGQVASSPGPIIVGYAVTQGVVTGLLTSARRRR